MMSTKRSSKHVAAGVQRIRQAHAAVSLEPFVSKAAAKQ